MDLIISQNDACDYEIRSSNLSSQLCDFVFMRPSTPKATGESENCNSLQKSNETTKRSVSTPNYERMLYFVCNLCPYLCIKDAKITEHLKKDHKDNKTNSKLLELKCPACPNIFHHNISFKSHLIHDHKVTSSDLRHIVRAVTYFSRKCSNHVSKPAENKTDTPTVRDTTCKNEIDLKTEKLMNSEEEINNEHSGSKENPEVVNTNVLENAIGKVCVFKSSRQKDIEMVEKIEVSSLRMMSLPLINITQDNLNNTSNGPVTAQKKTDAFSKLLGLKVMHKCTVPQCKVCLNELNKLEYHIKCHSETTFKCPECNEIFTFWKPLTAHLWRIHKIDMELFACDKCDYKSPSFGKLNNCHKLIHSDVRAFECEICSKKFKNTKQLRNHKALHKNKVKVHHACDICSKSFSDKRQLNVHLDGVHKKIKPFLCSYCGYKGASKSTLKMHIRQHTGEKPFSCESCEYSTADHNSLRRHKLRHTGQKPYKCSHCNYACIQATTYKEHIRTKHPGVEKDIVFICQECQFRSVNQEMYASHLFTVHQGKS